MKKERIDILGIGVDDLTMTSAIERIGEFLRDGKKHYVVTPNSEIAYECIQNENLRNVVNNADMVVPDGAGIILASKILKTPLTEKVAGIEIAANLPKYLAQNGYSLFLLGSKPGIAERASEKLCNENPGLNIVGVKDGYFKDDREAIDAINKAAPDVLYVCLGFPRQEFFISTYKNELVPRVSLGLGGSLDGITGEVKRAPKIFIKLNLEWFYRLLQQPSRIKRQLRLPKFVFAVLNYRRKNNRNT